MSEYAVVWRETGEPHRIYAGGLTIENDRVVLRGSAGRLPVVREVTRADIEAVQRVNGRERLGGFPSLRLDLAAGTSVLLASVMGLGVIFEVLDSLGP